MNQKYIRRIIETSQLDLDADQYYDMITEEFVKNAKLEYDFILENNLSFKGLFKIEIGDKVDNYNETDSKLLIDSILMPLFDDSLYVDNSLRIRFREFLTTNINHFDWIQVVELYSKLKVGGNSNLFKRFQIETLIYGSCELLQLDENKLSPIFSRQVRLKEKMRT